MTGMWVDVDWFQEVGMKYKVYADVLFLIKFDSLGTDDWLDKIDTSAAIFQFLVQALDEKIFCIKLYHVSLIVS